MGEGSAYSPELDFGGVEQELTQEKQMKEMLELSIFEMNNTIAELVKRLSRTDDEDSEWKTRYETQVELNKQLERQIGFLQGKVEHLGGNPTDKLASVRSFEQMHMNSLNQFLTKLEEEKKSLQNQLKEYELRLDQEAKISGSLKPLEKQKIDAVEMTRENQVLRRKCNIPRNQRILDPKKGPIKKTAGVKHLPKLKL
ncbi:coiled-coil domain-containing protein 169 isoform X2 [Protobothrops mucrosquamatus]|uniref:coiled-coil domain-containing protein 169 isoform X2 n=1 Tax=Protobothrops mucrosquamatus TaxID=103944 RepID=UPI000775FDDF|nr:coiled-coil domain-containing protein 169 isoform X2 [Protobothrops mucrosquamatus]